MDFTLDDEQRMMADTVGTMLAEECTTAALRRMLAEERFRDETRWSKLAELGLFGVLAPEGAGGLGLGEIDFLGIAEAAGRACLPEPLVEHAGIAVPLLAEAYGAGMGGAAAAALLEQAIAGEAKLAIGHPVNPFVADADTAEALLLVREDALHLVRGREVRTTLEPSVDPFRRLFRVDWSPDADTLLAAPGHAAPLIARAFERGALFSAAQCLGIAQRQVEIAVAYVKERTQFGKVIGAYQAIKHHLATVQVKIEFVRPVLQAAAAGLDAGDLAARTRVSHAKLAAGEAADLAGRTAVQVHGAMGYSWEVDVHFFLKRGLALIGGWGDRTFHQSRVAGRLFEASLPLGADRTFARESRSDAA